jgi:predicted phage tail protein
MRVVRLYGQLGKRFGRQHKLDVRSPAEAIRALSANFEGFAQAVVDGQWRVLVGGNAQALSQLHDPLSADISIVPAVAGAGAFGKVLVGAALIGVSMAFPESMFFNSPLGIIGDFILPTPASMISSLGFNLLMGGVSQMLFSAPKAPSGATERPGNKPSYAFSGAVNTTGQGNPVPVCYGRLRVGSQVISAGLHAESIAT